MVLAAIAVLASAVLVAPAWVRHRGREAQRARIQHLRKSSTPLELRAACGFDRGPVFLVAPTGSAPAGGRAIAWLAGWQTVGGCGAGAGTGSAAGIKWIGRGVSGGLFQVQCQASTSKLDSGQRDVATTVQITRELSDRWQAGVILPYLHKALDGFPRPDLRLSNKGLGDVGVLVTRRLGPIRATSATLVLGLPTGVHDARWTVGAQSAPLPQDLQLGIGRVTAALVVDHTFDRISGPILIGGTLNHRGGGNDLGSRRAPTAGLHGYWSTLLGPFVPVVGLTVTGALDHDASLGLPQDNPRLTLAFNGSLEWSNDWLALLVGLSLPVARGEGGVDALPLVLGAGVTFAPF